MTIIYVKLGYSTSNSPDYVFPSIVGRPMLRAEEGNLSTGFSKLALKDVMVGEEADAARAHLDIRYPMENGMVKSWEDMGAVWDHAFRDKLGLESGRGCKIMLTEPPLNPTVNRERMVERMLEGYGFDAVYVGLQATLVLYSQGLTSGLVVDSGDGVTHLVPVVEGVTPQHLIRRLDLAGRDVTRQLVKLLFHSGYAFNRTADHESIRQMKEELCYVAPDYERECKLARETTFVNSKYTLPDGRSIKVKEERFQAAEVLFRPYLADKEGDGLAQMTFNLIQAADIDLRPTLYRHIVLSGGTTTLVGFQKRLEKDLRDLYVERVLGGDLSRPNKAKIRVDEPPQRKHAVFVGGAVLADLMKDNPAFWVTREEWAEKGREALSKFK